MSNMLAACSRRRIFMPELKLKDSSKWNSKLDIKERYSQTFIYLPSLLKQFWGCKDAIMFSWHHGNHPATPGLLRLASCILVLCIAMSSPSSARKSSLKWRRFTWLKMSFLTNGVLHVTSESQFVFLWKKTRKTGRASRPGTQTRLEVNSLRETRFYERKPFIRPLSSI